MFAKNTLNPVIFRSIPVNVFANCYNSTVFRYNARRAIPGAPRASPRSRKKITPADHSTGVISAITFSFFLFSFHFSLFSLLLMRGVYRAYARAGPAAYADVFVYHIFVRALRNAVHRALGGAGPAGYALLVNKERHKTNLQHSYKFLTKNILTYFGYNFK